MKKSNIKWLGLAAAVAAFGFVVIGCNSGSGSGGNGPEPPPPPPPAFSISLGQETYRGSGRFELVNMADGIFFDLPTNAQELAKDAINPADFSINIQITNTGVQPLAGLRAVIENDTCRYFTLDNSGTATLAPGATRVITLVPTTEYGLTGNPDKIAVIVFNSTDAGFADVKLDVTLRLRQDMPVTITHDGTLEADGGENPNQNVNVVGHTTIVFDAIEDYQDITDVQNLQVTINRTGDTVRPNVFFAESSNTEHFIVVSHPAPVEGTPGKYTFIVRPVRATIDGSAGELLEMSAVITIHADGYNDVAFTVTLTVGD